MNRTAGALLVILLAACGTQTVTVPTEEEIPEGPVDPYGDPPDYAGDPFAGFDEIVTLDVPGETVVEPPIEIPEYTPVLPFAVQITAAAEEATAQRLAESVAADVDAPVFIDRIGQYWKVRVGAFATRAEADGLLEQLQAMGFADAWIVERIP